MAIDFALTAHKRRFLPLIGLVLCAHLWPGPRAALAAGQEPTLLEGGALAINGSGQFRYTHEASDSGPPKTSSFMIRAARLKLSGEVLQDFDYLVQIALDRRTGSDAAHLNSALFDFVLAYTPRESFQVSCGQFRMPVGAEANRPITKLDFVERYYAQGRIFNPWVNREIGVMVHGKPFAKRAHYALGIFNGGGRNRAANDDDNFIYTARLDGTAWRGEIGGRKAQLSAGVGGSWERTADDPSKLASADLPDSTIFSAPYDRSIVNGDAAFQLGGWALKGELIRAELSGRSDGDPTVVAGGYYVQGSSLFAGDKLQALVRYQTYDPDDSETSAKDIEWTSLGLNHYIQGHNVKLMANYTFKRELADSVDNDELVLQMQLAF